jgi:quercetin 2,3-dioxygenase
MPIIGFRLGSSGVELMWNDAFIFVIDGVFEVQNRLLHRRDALLLPAPEKLEFEALSEGAILLVLEIK